MRKYSIGEVSKIFGMSVQAIRLYQKLDLVHPIINEETGYRYFDEPAFEELWRIKVMQSAGFELKEISSFSDLSIDEMKEIIVQKKDALELLIKQKTIAFDFLGRQLNDFDEFEKTPQVELKYFERRYGYSFQGPDTNNPGDFIVELTKVEGVLGVNQEVVHLPTRRTRIVNSQVELVDFVAMDIGQNLGNAFYEAGWYLCMNQQGMVDSKITYQTIMDYANKNGFTLRGDAVELIRMNSTLIYDSKYRLKEIQVAVLKD